MSLIVPDMGIALFKPKLVFHFSSISWCSQQLRHLEGNLSWRGRKKEVLGNFFNRLKAHWWQGMNELIPASFLPRLIAYDTLMPIRGWSGDWLTALKCPGWYWGHRNVWELPKYNFSLPTHTVIDTNLSTNAQLFFLDNYVVWETGTNYFFQERFVFLKQFPFARFWTSWSISHPSEFLQPFLTPSACVSGKPNGSPLEGSGQRWHQIDYFLQLCRRRRLDKRPHCSKGNCKSVLPTPKLWNWSYEVVWQRPGNIFLGAVWCFLRPFTSDL